MICTLSLYYEELSFVNIRCMQKPMSIVVLTGAGVSAESGIETFRAADGLWANHPVDEVATPEGFERNPPVLPLTRKSATSCSLVWRNALSH